MTQAVVAKVVGIDRSSVSRHVKNHVYPTVAAEVVIGSDVSARNVIDEIDRLYGRLWALFEVAAHSGDLRLARDLAKELRQILSLTVNVGDRMAEGGLRHLSAMSAEGMALQAKELREELTARMNDLAERNKRMDKFYRFNTSSGQWPS